MLHLFGYIVRYLVIDLLDLLNMGSDYDIPDFDALTKAFDKAKKVVDKEGIPRFYIKTLVELEDFVAEVRIV